MMATPAIRHRPAAAHVLAASSPSATTRPSPKFSRCGHGGGRCGGSAPNASGSCPAYCIEGSAAGAILRPFDKPSPLSRWCYSFSKLRSFRRIEGVGFPLLRETERNAARMSVPQACRRPFLAERFLALSPWKIWCPGGELNTRHRDFQSRALPTELPGQAVRFGRKAAVYRGWVGACPAARRRPDPDFFLPQVTLTHGSWCGGMAPC
jgi:hypothetical protein